MKLVKRGDKVMLFGKYEATVCQDEEMDKDTIKLTKPEAFDTEEEEDYADYFQKDIIDKSEDLIDDDFTPSQQDWDDVMFNDSEEEPGLTDDEMGAAHDAEEMNNKQKDIDNMKHNLTEAELRNMITKLVKESLEDMAEEPMGVDAEALCDNIMEQAKSELGEDAERYRKSCMMMCERFLAKHTEFNDIDDAYDALMEEPTPERSRYMKLFHFQEWKQNATVDDLFQYQMSKKRWDDEKCHQWAEAEYAKMHGGNESGEPAGLDMEKLSEAIIKAIKEQISREDFKPGGIVSATAKEILKRGGKMPAIKNAMDSITPKSDIIRK